MAVESQAWRAGKPSLHQASRPQASRPPDAGQQPSGLPQASKPSGLHQQPTSGLRQPATGPPPIGGKLSAIRATKPASKKRPSAPAAKSMPVAKRHKAGALGCQSLVFSQVYEVDSNDDSAVGEEATSLSLCLPSFHAWMSMCPGSAGGGPGSS